MFRFLSNFFSIIFNPLLAPTALFYLSLYAFPGSAGIYDHDTKVKAMIFIFASTFLFSFVLIYILYKLKLISAITLDKQSDRYIPQLVLSVLYLAIAFWLSHKLGLCNGLTLGMLATGVSAGIITIINRFWKISTHASGVSGVFAIASVLFWKYPSSGFLPMYAFIAFITVAVCASRLYLKAHTPMQIVCGFLLGAVSGFLLFYYC